MTDLFTAKAQLYLSILWIVGFFLMVTGQGLGYLKEIPWDSLFALTGVVLFFWFQRARAQQNSDPEPPLPKPPQEKV